MAFVIVAWAIIGQLMSLLLGIRGIIYYLLGFTLFVLLNGFQAIPTREFTIIFYAMIALVMLVVLVIQFRKRLMGNDNMQVHSLLLSGLGISFIVGSMIRPGIGLITGGIIAALPFGRVLRYKGIGGLIQIYFVTLIQWLGTSVLTVYIIWIASVTSTAGN